jgi:hypothetical protein
MSTGEMSAGILSNRTLRVHSPCARTAGVDASGLTSLIGWSPAYRVPAAGTGGAHSHMLMGAYLGLVRELARAMDTTTDNRQFRDFLRYIFPFACTAISSRLTDICGFVLKAATDSKYIHDTLSRHIAVGELTFRLHPRIIHTEPLTSRVYYDTRIPQQLTTLASGIDSEVSTPFLYYFRCHTIKSLVLHHLYASKSNLECLLLSFLNSVCSFSGMGYRYCYEYYSIQRLLHSVPTEIQLYRLSDDSVSQVPTHVKLCSKHTSSFSTVNRVQFDASGETLFVPFMYNYSSFDAIGMGVFPVGKRLVKHLVFYQITSKDKHPVCTVLRKCRSSQAVRLSAEPNRRRSRSYPPSPSPSNCLFPSPSCFPCTSPCLTNSPS